VGVEQVGLHERRLAAVAHDRFDDAFAARAIAAVDDDPGAEAGEQPRHRLSDAGGRAGDDRHAAVEVVRSYQRMRHGISMLTAYRLPLTANRGPLFAVSGSLHPLGSNTDLITCPECIPSKAACQSSRRSRLPTMRSAPVR